MRKSIYKPTGVGRSQLKTVEKFEGEPLNWKVRRIKEEQEPIKDGAPIVFTDPKEGVNPAYNIRTDRWEVATDAMDKVSAQKLAERSGKVIDLQTGKEKNGVEGGGSEGTSEQSGGQS